MYIRDTMVCPGYKGMSGVRGYDRGTMVCPGYEGMSGVRWYVRGTMVCPGYEGMSGVRGYVCGTKLCPLLTDTKKHTHPVLASHRGERGLPEIPPGPYVLILRESLPDPGPPPLS